MYIHVYAYLDLASTKSRYSPSWRVQNLFGEYEIEVTRHFGEYEIFLMSNPAAMEIITVHIFTVRPMLIMIVVTCDFSS